MFPSYLDWVSAMLSLMTSLCFASISGTGAKEFLEEAITWLDGKNPAGIGSNKIGRSNMNQGTLTTSHTLQCAVVSFNKSKLPSMHDTSLAWLTRSLPATNQVDGPVDGHHKNSV